MPRAAGRQARSLGHIISRMRKQTISRPTQKAHNEQLNRTAATRMKTRIGNEPFEQALLQQIRQSDAITNAMRIPHYKRAKNSYEGMAQVPATKEASDSRSEWKKACNDTLRSIATTARALKPRAAAPPDTVAKPEIGTDATTPNDTDAIMRECTTRRYLQNAPLHPLQEVRLRTGLMGTR